VTPIRSMYACVFVSGTSICFQLILWYCDIWVAAAIKVTTDTCHVHGLAGVLYCWMNTEGNIVYLPLFLINKIKNLAFYSFRGNTNPWFICTSSWVPGKKIPKVTPIRISAGTRQQIPALSQMPGCRKLSWLWLWICQMKNLPMARKDCINMNS